jgi:hypothetical protein
MIYSGDNLTGEIVNGSSDTIYGGSAFSITVAGANDTVNLGTSSHVLLISGDNNDDIHGSNDIIVAQPNVIDDVFGSNDTYNGQFGSFDGDPVSGPGDDGSSFWDDCGRTTRSCSTSTAERCRPRDCKTRRRSSTCRTTASGCIPAGSPPAKACWCTTKTAAIP